MNAAEKKQWVIKGNPALKCETNNTQKDFSNGLDQAGCQIVIWNHVVLWYLWVLQCFLGINGHREDWKVPPLT
jgi:hypothetical protein